MARTYGYLAVFAVTHLSLLLIYPPSVPRVLSVLAFFGCGLTLILLLIFHPRIHWLAPARTLVPSGARPAVALTFDDGPSPEVTPRVLAILREKAVPATFFCVGREVERHPELARLVAAAGHEIGSHSYGHHPLFGFLLPGRMRREIAGGQRAIAAATGVTPRLFRPPVGERHPYLADALARASLSLVMWDLRTYDTRATTAAELTARILGGVRPGSILLMHDRPGAGAEAMIEALPGVIDRLRERGFDFVTAGGAAGDAVADAAAAP